jgi:hypothetical protein
VQNYTSTKYLQFAQMDLVYQRALLIIAAISGHDAHSVLPGAGPLSRPQRHIIEHKDALMLTFEPLPLKHLLEHYIYFKGAWILQELLMSRRVLFFTSSQVHFACKVLEASEISPEGKDFRPNYPRPTNPIIQFQNAIARGDDVEWRLICKSYFELLIEYKSRELSYPGDILNAFAGLQSIYEHRCCGIFHFGLPDFMFDRALLWVPKHSATCRKAFIMDERYSTLKFPSWSWTGWVGRRWKIEKNHFQYLQCNRM